MATVTVHSPATVANLVCGFDVLGLALNAPQDVLTITTTPGHGSITITNNDAFGLPTDPAKNVMGAAIRAMLEAGDLQADVHIESLKRIKPGSGIGSSAASAAGAVVGLNALVGNRFSKTELVQFAMEGEALASGARHADNVAPAIFGGVTLVRSTQPLDIIPLPAPDLFVVVLHPQIEVKTADSRAVVKQQVPLSKAIEQWGNVGALVAGLLMNDTAIIGRSLNDVIVEPERAVLIPHFKTTKKAAIQAGALGGGISGSGPSIFMLCDTAAKAAQVAEAMKQAYTETGIDFELHTGSINHDGASVI
jgi:homoserine kinase